MIYTDRFAFLHIPRTAGIAITTALRRALSGCAWDTGQDRHLYAWQLRERLQENWQGLFRFAVIRSPWEIVASDWRLTCRDVESPQWTRDWTPDWQARLDRVRKHRSFATFVEEEYLGPYSGLMPGGFWRTYCCDQDGRELGVHAFRFERLNQDWPAIAVRCGCPGAVLPTLNGTEHSTTPWTRALVEAVGQRCREDLTLFDYRPPGGIYVA